MMSDYIEEQALKRIKGSIEDPIISTVSLENIKEKTKRAVETYDIKPKNYFIQFAMKLENIGEKND
jgi:hypothetical protein